MDVGCFGKRMRERYIFKHDNDFQVLGILDKEFQNKEKLDMSGLGVWICDDKLNIIVGTNSDKNKLKTTDFVGKNIYDVHPKDFGKFCGDLHKSAQETKEEKKINILLNDRIVFIVAKPIIFFDEVIASSLCMIPYKHDVQVCI